MSVRKKLNKWAEAQLVSEEQARQILAFEKSRSAGRLLKGVYGLGAFAILVGILAIIAANWQIIPAYTKIFVHLAVNGTVACGIYYFALQEKNMAREFSLFALTGLNLTLIALVGQVFHLNGSLESALVLWMLISTPFAVLFGKTKISLVPWLLGFIAAIFAAIHEYVFPYMDAAEQKIFAVGAAAFLPLTFIQMAGALQKTEHSVLRKLLFYAGITGAVLVPNIACQYWYSEHIREFVISFGPRFFVLGIFVIACFAARIITIPAARNMQDVSENTRLLLCGGLVTSILPFIFPAVESSFLAAASFIAYWLFLGFIGQRTDRQGLVTAAIIIIAIRIYLIYLEVFGSMLETGFGLVVSGLVLIGMVWGVRHINKNLEAISLEGNNHE